MNERKIKVLILGGGYAGIMAAVRLAGRAKKELDLEISLVNGLDHFVERPLLHHETVGIIQEKTPIRQMLRGTGVQFIQGWVTGLDANLKEVIVSSNESAFKLGYDYLIYALGSSANRQSIPGAAEFAYALDPFGQHASADLAGELAQFKNKPGRVAIIGGGPTGVETAAEIKSAYAHLQVHLVSEGRIGAFKGEKVFGHISQALYEQGIFLHEKRRVTAISSRRVHFAAEYLDADIIIWAGGFTAPALAGQAGVSTNDRRQILVDPTLRSISHPAIFAAGDAAMTLEEPGAPMRMSLYVAVVSGAQAADNLAALLQGQAPRPLSYAWYGQGIALGREDAVGFLTYPAGELSGPILRGKTAVKIRNFFVRLLGASLEIERRFPGSIWWNGRGRYARQRAQRKSKSSALAQGAD